MTVRNFVQRVEKQWIIPESVKTSIDFYSIKWQNETTTSRNNVK